MKYNREILILSVFLIFFIYIGGPLSVEAMPEKPENNIPPVIRFHIRANSNTQEDQDLKLEVRDKVLEKMEPMFEDSNSLDESREIILESSDKIRSIAKDVVSKWGRDYDVNVILREEAFPVRKYGDLVFPQGDYEALIIELGDAKGENWWCVMFPPICLVDVTHSVAIEEYEKEPEEEEDEMEDKEIKEDIETNAKPSEDGKNKLEQEDKDIDSNKNEEKDIDENEPNDIDQDKDKNNDTYLDKEIEKRREHEESKKDSPLNEFIIDETRPFKLKSKIYDFFQSLF